MFKISLPLLCQNMQVPRIVFSITDQKIVLICEFLSVVRQLVAISTQSTIGLNSLHFSAMSIGWL